ncbi:uncharacterized protein LOC116308158 [Actinia tenebrosa]|uniref:Uncharacterized protein LOC116308158 n=1 Tax=Actinia tenebrosa TaxID=6105 RepID=A0A6P8J465_ACTTE|nr:uncharacterized protein LOC116308158 [Actinia tenebrosa]
MAISTVNVLQKLRSLINEAILPEDLQSTPWNDFVFEILSHEMATRRLRMNTVIVWECYARKWRELLPDLKASQSWPVYSGSYTEGMPNAGDLDTMLIASWVVVYEYTGKMVDNVKQLPFVTTSDCHPGFIQIIVPHATRKVYDFKDYQIRKIGRHFYLRSDGFLRTMQGWGTTGSNYEVHGPAFTLSATEATSYDIIHAIRCTHWPAFAQDIFNRTKMPADLVEKLKSSSLYAVATGHALSKDADVQWRLSFSEAENHLVKNWNETQFYCYFLLKNFKMIHLKNPDILCSYFMKTVIFWMSEVLPQEWWNPSRLIKSFCTSLFILQSMFRNHCLPNYFIPQNNMIDHKKRNDCLALADTLHSILSSGRMKVIIAELLCEEQLEIVYQVVNNVPTHIPVRSCRNLCTIVRQYCQSTVSFSEALLVNEATILSSLTVMMTVWNKTQCKAMEAILTKLPELVSPDMVNVFHVMITRQIADSYHSLSTRDSKKRAEHLYKESLTLVYPCGFDDEGLSGTVQLALFYYLEGNTSQALTVLRDIIPVIVKAVKMNSVRRYIFISFSLCMKERFARDEFLYKEVSSSKGDSRSMPYICGFNPRNYERGYSRFTGFPARQVLTAAVLGTANGG